MTYPYPYPSSPQLSPDSPRSSLPKSPLESEDSRFLVGPSKPALWKIFLWTSFALFCLTSFTLLKLPEDRIKFILESYVNSALEQQGVTLSSESGKLSLFFGIKYTFKGVLLKLPVAGLAPVRFHQIEVSPSLIPLVIGKQTGKIKIDDLEQKTKGERTLEVKISQRKNQKFISFQAKKFSLEKIAFFPLVLGVQGSAELNGAGNLEGDFNHLNSLTGNLKINLSQIGLEPQVIEGFNLPKMTVSNANASVVIEKGKGTLKEFRLGSVFTEAQDSNGGDDLRGHVTGDLLLMDTLAASQFNLKTYFSISDTVMKSFVLLDALLGSGKQPDGTYAFELTGPFSSINAQPISSAGP